MLTMETNLQAACSHREPQSAVHPAQQCPSGCGPHIGTAHKHLLPVCDQTGANARMSIECIAENS